MYPSIPGNTPKSPAVNPATGNLFMTLPVVSSSAYDAPSQLIYNSLSAYDAIQYGYGFAGRYNQVIQNVNTFTADLIDGSGTTYEYTDLNTGTGYYTAPPGAVFLAADGRRLGGHAAQRPATGVLARR